MLLHLHIHAEHNQFIAYENSEFSACTSVAYGDNKYLSYTVFTAYIMYNCTLCIDFGIFPRISPYIFPMHLCF